MQVKALVFCVVLLSCHFLEAQSLQWLEGSLVQSDNQVLVGEISLAADYDLVLFKQGETRMVFPAHKLKSLYFYDNKDNLNRRYVSVKTKDGVRSRHQLYEVVLKGKIDILRRKKPNAFSIQTDVLDYDYYTYYNAALVPLKKFKRSIYIKSPLQSDERLLQFMNKQRLSVDLPMHVIKIVEYYNDLVKATAQFAKN